MKKFNFWEKLNFFIWRNVNMSKGQERGKQGKVNKPKLSKKEKKEKKEKKRVNQG